MLAAIVFAVFGSYWIPKLVVSLMPTQDLKRKYDAQWALVTGSSSGIGKSLASRLASQGLNVVMVALNDRLLDDAVSELKTTFTSGQIIKVGLDIGVPG